MSARSSRNSSISKTSRRFSNASSTSTLDSRRSNSGSHASLDTKAWNIALAGVSSIDGPRPKDTSRNSETVRVSVNEAGKVRAKRTTYAAQANQLPLETLKKLTDKKPAVCGVLRLRHHPSRMHSDPELVKQELHVYPDDDRRATLKQVRKKSSAGRSDLAKNLKLRPGTGDRYILRSHLEGPRYDSGLYAAADDDLRLEEAVYNASKDTFGAEAGVMRMPLEKPDPQFMRKASDSGEYEGESDPSGYRWYTGDRCYDVSSSTKTRRHPIKRVKRDQFEHVTQETYRAGTRRSKFTLNKPEGPGDYHTRYESLRPIPGGSQLEHEDLRIYSMYSKR